MKKFNVITLLLLALRTTSFVTAMEPEVVYGPKTIKEQSDLDYEFLDAIENNRITYAAALLERGADVNATEWDHESALELASWHGTTAMVKLLIDNHAAISHCEALIGAATRGSIDKIKLLLEHGENINAQDREYGFTALMHAVHWGRTEAVRFLVEHGANIYLHDKKGKTALQKALHSPSIEAISYLAPLYAAQGAMHAMLTCADFYPKEFEEYPFQPEVTLTILMPILASK